MIDFKRLLPKAAKQVLTDLLYKKMEASKLDCYADPTYRYADALREFSDHMWDASVLYKCFEAAKKRYESEHPKRRDGKRQLPFREGYPRLRIVEHVSSVWSYHLAEQGQLTSLCGKGTMMNTAMSLDQWGVEHDSIPYKWCAECKEKSNDQL